MSAKARPNSRRGWKMLPPFRSRLRSAGTLRARKGLAREVQQMVIGRPLRDIAKELVGADDLPELQRRVVIVRVDVGVSTFHGLTEGGPETFSIILRKGPEQIVKRFHPRPAAGFPGLRPKFPPRICCGALVPTDLHRLWIMLIQYGRKMTRGTRPNRCRLPIGLSLRRYCRPDSAAHLT